MHETKEIGLKSSFIDFRNNITEYFRQISGKYFPVKIKKLIKNSKIMMYSIKSHYISYIKCISHQVFIKFWVHSMHF